MNKLEAEQFIQQSLAQGDSQETVVRALIAELRAPHELVVKFVAQTAEALSTTMPTPPSTNPAPTGWKLPPWLDADAGPIKATPSVEATRSANPPSSQVEAGGVTLSRGSQSTRSESKAKLDDLIQDPSVKNHILDELNSNHYDDVIMWVCERSGVSWEEAERLVAEVSIEHEKMRAAGKSEIWMIAGLLLAISGFVLAAIFGLGLLAFGLPQIHLPFGTALIDGQPLMASALFTLGMLMVGSGAALAYLYYHAAEEHEA